MRIRAIASDYDDTLAREGRVSQETTSRLLAARRSGIKVVLITGRQIPELREVFDRLALVDLVVAENGGYCFSPSSNVGWRIAPAVDGQLVSEMQARGVEHLAVGETIIATLTSQLPLVEQAVQVRADRTHHYDLIRNRESLMVLPRGINKGTGLREALRFLRIPPECAVAVGDAENDIPLLQTAGRGVAVGDAIDALKDIADLVTTAPGPQGVIELFDSLHDDGWSLHKRRQARAG